MGGIRRNKKRNKNKQNANKPNDNRDERRPYKEILRENEDFIKYYKAQGLIADGDWPEFLAVMRSDLPTAFRIGASSREESRRLLKIVRGDFFERLVKPEGDAADAADARTPFALPWYPDELGWQVKISRKDIRRSESYFRLHNFLMQETSCGAISRQETVSMIPPLVLGVRPWHKVLDMCAAPGSKTAQIIELLHSEGDKTPDGFVIANDVDNTRCYMLVHQAKRLNSACCAITNHEAGSMPNFVITKEGGTEILKFDRILCDVPCSGDGTLRKNPDIWPKWNTANANNLHGVQYRIVKRGLEMLRTGGRLVYSTCSLNPVENEAVVSRILADADGSVELADCGGHLPGLVHTAGLDAWKPASKDATLYDAFDDVDDKWRTQVRPTMFPPSSETIRAQLKKCIRILPHHQDTGGFFVAALVKIGTLPWEAKAGAGSGSGSGSGAGGDGEDGAEEEPPSSASAGPPAPKKRRIYSGYREDPYVFFGTDEPVWKDIKNFYEIDGLDCTCLLTRCLVGKKKNIYFVSAGLKEAISSNRSGVKVINTGVKVFSRCDNKSMVCSFRLVQEGLDSIEKFIGRRRRLKLSKDEMIRILYRTDPKCPLDIEQLSESTKARIEEISPGSCILEYLGEENDDEKFSVVVVGWRGAKSIRAYIPLSDAIHYLRLLGASVEQFEVNKFKKQNEMDATTENDHKEEEENEEKSVFVDENDDKNKPVERQETEISGEETKG